MDSNRRYGWRTHNFVFDNNLNKYVEKQSQYRTTRFVDSSTTPVNNNNNNIYSSSRNTECFDSQHHIDVGNPVNKYQQNQSVCDNIVSESKTVKHKTQNKDKKRQWAKSKSKSKSLKVTIHKNRYSKLNQANNECIMHSNLNIQVPSNNEYIILTHHYITLILSNWYRIYKYKPITNSLIISCLMSYSIQRFEFDEFHPLIQSWVNYNMDDDISMGSSSSSSTYTTPRQRHILAPLTPSISIPIQLIKSQTSDHDVDEVQCPSEDSLSISTNDVPFVPFVSLCSPSEPEPSQTSQTTSNYNEKILKHHTNYECTASLPNVKWSTIFFGSILNSNLLHKNTYVCNVKINKLGYGVGFAFFGHNTHSRDVHNDIYYNRSKLNKIIQDEHNGYPDKMDDCFVVYDDGEFCDWHNTQNNNNKFNANDLPDRYTNNTIKVISKLSKIQLKTTKSKQFSLSPSVTSPTNLSVPSDDENNKNNKNNKTKARKKVMTRSKSKKDFYTNPKQKRVLPRAKSASDYLLKINRNTNTSYTSKKYNFYGKRPKNRSKAKHVTEKFGFDEKSDIIQISIDLYHKKISIHNINNHRCIVIKNFNYDLIRMAFVLRYSNITVIDQKWV